MLVALLTKFKGKIMAASKTYKKGDIVVEGEKMVEFNDKQGNPRKAMKKFSVTANAFSTVQWYGVTITGGVKYYVDKALEFDAVMAGKEKSVSFSS